MKVEPSGTFASIHSPASRPPGSPPDPASALPSSGTSILATVAMRRVVLTMPGHGGQRVPRLLSARPASTASGAAIGSRYW